MRLAVGLVVRICLPLAEGQGVGQRRPTRSNVHGAAASKIQRGQVVQPAIRVPRPASDGAVHDRSPEEPEDEGWDDATTLESTADHDLHGTGAEQELVEAESNIRDRRVADRRGGHHVAQPKVGEVTDEGARRAAVGQGEAPEHPLEGGDCPDHEGLEEEGEGGLAAGEASVQEPDARDNEPYDEGAEDQVRVVVLETHVLGIHVHLERVAAGGL